MANQLPREILDKALKRREELRLESEALDSLIETYRRLLSLAPSAPPADQLHLWQGGSPRAQQAAYISELLEESKRIILAEKRPMKRGELVQRLERLGYKLPGGDKNKVFGTNLWRSGEFVQVEGQGYWPEGVSLPAGSETI